MATDLENLQAAKSALLASLAANAGRPNYTIDGETMDFNGLMDRIAKIDAAMAAVQGPFEHASLGET